MRDHEKRFADRIRAIKESSNNLGNVSSKLNTAVRNAWGTMDKAASEYGVRMAQTIQEIAEALSREETPASYQGAEKFHDTSVVSLNKIIKTVRRYVPKLHKGLRSEMAALNLALGKLEMAVRSLGSALDDSPGKRIESMMRDVQLLVQKHDELVRLRSEQNDQAAALNSILETEKELLGTHDQLASEDAFLELKRYEDSLKADEDKIRLFLQPIIKPLIKLERTQPTKGAQTVDARMLRGVVEKPVETVAAGQSFALVQLANQLDEALMHRKLEVEDRRRRRAEDTIQQIRDGAVEKMREDYLALQANLQETLRQLKGTGLLDKKAEVDEQLATTRHDKESANARKVELQRRIQDITSSVMRQKSSIEEQIAKMTKSEMTIRTD